MFNSDQKYLKKCKISNREMKKLSGRGYGKDTGACAADKIRARAKNKLAIYIQEIKPLKVVARKQVVTKNKGRNQGCGLCNFFSCEHYFKIIARS